MSHRNRLREAGKNRVFDVLNNLKVTFDNKILLFILTAIIVLAFWGFFQFFKSDTQEERLGKKGTMGEIREVGEVIEEETNSDKGQDLPFSWQDSIKTIKTTAQEMKKKNAEKQVETVKVATKETLILSMPIVNNWRPDPPQYHRGAYGIHETANLNTVYKRPKFEEVFVEIIDFGSAISALQPLKMIFAMNNSADDYRRYARVSEYNGIKVFEEYNKKTRLVEFSFIVKERYIINLKTRGNQGTSVLKEFTEAFDFSKLD